MANNDGFRVQLPHGGDKMVSGPSPGRGFIQTSKINSMVGKPTMDGKIDKNGEVRLRIGIVDNPTIKRTKEGSIDPLDPYSVVNMTTGKIAIRWVEQEGGVIRNQDFGTYGNNGELSDRESLALTHPIMWANSSNWFGINYLPPVGSIVIVGFRKHNLPILLGFLQPHYEVTSPLQLGEIMNKGFGNNTSHWRMYDEQVHKAWVTKGQMRPTSVIPNVPGRKYTMEPSDSNVDVMLKIKAGVNPHDSKSRDDYRVLPSDQKHLQNEIIQLYIRKETDSKVEQSIISVTPQEILMESSNGSDNKSTFSISPNSIELKSNGKIIIDGDLVFNKDIDMSGKKITNIGYPTSETDATNKSYVDSSDDIGER